MYPSEKPTFMLPRPFDGTEEVYDEYYDTAGNYHYTGTITGHHVIRKSCGYCHEDEEGDG